MRRRFRYNKELEKMVEIGLDEPSTRPAPNTDSILWNDRLYQDAKTTDGVDISSRSKHREYMREHNLTTADDFKETWKREEQRRAEYLTTGKGGAVRGEDVARAMEQVLKSRR